MSATSGRGCSTADCHAGAVGRCRSAQSRTCDDESYLFCGRWGQSARAHSISDDLGEGTAGSDVAYLDEVGGSVGRGNEGTANGCGAATAYRAGPDMSGLLERARRMVLI
ncbi:hypothetical protein GOPIP_077_00470 [Gordonia polyisoprenivorans NBRC 16320 = JCM 10675]|nr:hypothetical protein GOPIP_077_00470 [Gordonia polyisoprenivorans NBRC 16320 = JCM 10675]